MAGERHPPGRRVSRRGGSIVIVFATAFVWLGLSLGVAWLVCSRMPLLAPVAGGLAVSLLAVYLAVVFFDVPFGSGTDEVVYHTQASGVGRSLLLTGETASRYVMLDEGKHGWPTVLGVLYWFSGSTSPYVGLFVNANVTFAALLLSAAAGQRIYPASRPGPWHVMLLVASPTVLFLGVSLLRDPLAWLAIALSVHALLVLLRSRAALGAAVLLLACLLAFWLRAPLAVIIVAASVGALMVIPAYRRWGVGGAMITMLAAFLAGLQVLVPLLAAAGYSPSLLLIARDYLATISTTGFIARDPFTPVGMVEALVRVGVGPFPWEYAPAAVWAWVLGNHLYWLAVLALAVLAIRRYGMDLPRMALLAFCTVLLAGIAVGLTNYGIVVRMRGSLIIAALPLAWGALPLVTARTSREGRS